MRRLPCLTKAHHLGKGLYEHVQRVKRYLPGQWPHVAPDVFTTKGAVTMYKTVPPSEGFRTTRRPLAPGDHDRACTQCWTPDPPVLAPGLMGLEAR